MSNQIELPRIQIRPERLWPKIGVALVAFVIGIVLWSSVYTVREYEQAVVLRFGKFQQIAGPGLHFKVPWIDERILVVTSERNVRMPWGIDDKELRGQQLRVTRESEEQSLILTGDLYGAVVEWTVVWNVVEPYDFVVSFDEDDAEDVVVALARSTMHRVVGDYSADEILTAKREEIGMKTLAEMTEQLEHFQCGIAIVDLQMQRVTPPERVKPSFDDVNASIQERDKFVNQARAERAKMIPSAQAMSDQLIREAEGYAARRKAEAEGEITALLAKYESYKVAPEATRRRLYLEAMEEVLMQSGPKTILDADLKGLVPLLNLNDESLVKPTPPKSKTSVPATRRQP